MQLHFLQQASHFGMSSHVYNYADFNVVHMLGIVFLMLTKPDNILFLFFPFLLIP